MKIAVFITKRDSDVVYNLLKGIYERARQDNVDIFVFFCDASPNVHNPSSKGAYKIFSLPHLSDFDGAIMVAQQIQLPEVIAPMAEMITKSAIPAVCIERNMKNMVSVGIDNYKSMSRLVEHIFEEHSPHNIFYIKGIDNANNQDRLRAAQDVMSRHGIQLSKEKIFSDIYNYWDAFELADKLYKQYGKENLPDCFVCDYDDSAYGIMDYFNYRTNDVRIPGDIIITGFNRKIESNMHYCPMTTVEKPTEQIGYAACEQIVNHVRDGKTMKSQRFPGKIFIGKSCGCNAAEKNYFRDSQKENYTYSLRKKYFSFFMNEMTETLMAANNNDEFMEGIKKALPETRADSFYMMLEERVGEAERSRNTGENNSFPYIVEVPLIWKDRLFSVGKEMETTHLLPDYNESHGDLYLVYSLHYQQHVKGYCVFKNPWYLLENNFLSDWIQSLNSSLEICGQRLRLMRMNERLNRLYTMDSLTGLLNRFGYEKEMVGRFIKNHEENKVSMVAFVDLDRLKYINDTFGHEFGDIAILSVTGVIKRTFPKDFLEVRFGGDEFILFGECIDQNIAESYIEALNKEFEKTKNWDALPFEISASIGYVLTDPKSPKTLAEYVQDADKLMYEQKMRHKELRRQASGQEQQIDDRLL